MPWIFQTNYLILTYHLFHSFICLFCCGLISANLDSLWILEIQTSFKFLPIRNGSCTHEKKSLMCPYYIL